MQEHKNFWDKNAGRYHNKQESIYREGNNANLLADTQNKK